jgi:2-methylisocitrate lyase-like PEP mutase family enzyme
VTSVPLTVDFEGGFSAQPSEVAERVGDLLDLGVAGINIEDGDAAPELLAQKIAAIKAWARTRGADIFVNARTDVVLRGLTPPGDATVRETIARAARYREAGADGIFVPALVEPDAIRTIAASIGLPLNVMAVPGLPDAPALYALGVRRLSAGSGLAELAFGTARHAAAAFLASGDAAVLTAAESLDYGATNARF